METKRCRMHLNSLLLRVLLKDSRGWIPMFQLNMDFYFALHGFSFYPGESKSGKKLSFSFELQHDQHCRQPCGHLPPDQGHPPTHCLRTNHQLGPLDILKEEVGTEHPQRQKLQVGHGSFASQLLLIHPNTVTPPLRLPAVQILQVCTLQPQARNTH